MAKDTKSNKDVKNKKHFFKDFKAELKKVIWPTPKQLFNNTVAVLVIVIITGIIVFALDFTFESINKYGIDKIKQQVSNSANNENVSNDIEESNIETEQDNVENNQETDNVIIDEANNTVEE